nr:hypothetical protein JVH1_0039 [Rhodococcus sp. JVH1]
MAEVNLAKRALLGRGAAVRTRDTKPEIRRVEHAPVRKCRDKTGPTRLGRGIAVSAAVFLPRHPGVGVTRSSTRPASQASVWDTVEPAAPHGVTGSREARTSSPPATSVAESMRFT